MSLNQKNGHPLSRLDALIEVLRESAVRHSTRLAVQSVETWERLLDRLRPELSGRVHQGQAAQRPAVTDTRTVVEFKQELSRVSP